MDKRSTGRPRVADGDTSHLHIRVKPAEKAAWVRAAQSHYQAMDGAKGGLSDWTKMVLNAAAQTKEK